MERNYGSAGYYMQAPENYQMPPTNSGKCERQENTDCNDDAAFKGEENSSGNRGTTCQFLKEPFGLLILLGAVSAISINLFTVALLALALLQCSFSFQNCSSSFKKNCIVSILGITLTLVFCGLQSYAVAIVFMRNLSADENTLIRAAGVTMSREKSLGENILEGCKCFLPDIIALVCFAWLLAFYKSRAAVNKLPPRNLSWLYSPTLWTCLALISMFCSACSNISISGLIFLLLGLTTTLQWSMHNNIKATLKIVMRVAVCLSAFITISSGLLHLTLISNLLLDYLYIAESFGVEMFGKFGVVECMHYGFTLCACVSGIFYFRMSEFGASFLARDYGSCEETLLLSEDSKEAAPKDSNQHEDSSFLKRLKSAITEYLYTPYFYLHIAQILVLVWIVRFNSVLAVPQMCWLMCSTIYSIGTERFYCITKFVMFPYTVLNAIYFYVVNIYNLPLPKGNTELCKLLGLLLIREDSYTIFFFEFLVIVGTLICFCHIFKRQGEFAQPKHRRSSLLEGSPTLKLISLFVAKHLDKLFMVFLYFQGTEAATLFHAGVVAYFLLFLIYPASGKRCFVFLLLYFEVILMSRIMYGVVSFVFAGSSVEYTAETIAVLVGVYAEVFPGAAAGRVNIGFGPIAITVIVYLQYAVYCTSLYNNKSSSRHRESFAPLKGIIYAFLFVKNVVSWLYIWIVYLLLITVIILSPASIMNFIFLTLILVLIAVHMWNETARKTKGEQHTRQMWIVLLLYCGAMVFTLYVYQFLGTRILGMFLRFLYAPQGLTDYIHIVGYKLLKDDYLWLSLFPYFALLFLTVIGSRYVHKMQEDSEDLIVIPAEAASATDFSHFLAKIQAVWPVFDAFSTFSFDLLAFVMLVLAVCWSLSLGMYLVVGMISAYYFAAHVRIYREAASPNRDLNSVPSLRNIKEYLNATRRKRKSILVATRDKYWKVLYVGFLIVMLLAYMSRFMDLLYVEIAAYTDDPVAVLKWFNVFRFVGLWLGFYHAEVTGATSFAFDSLGYFIFFVLLLIERKSTQWYHNRLNAEEEKSSEIEAYEEAKYEPTHCTSVEELLEISKSEQEQATKNVNEVEIAYGKEVIKTIFEAIAVNYYKTVHNKSEEMDYYQLLLMKAIKNVLEVAILFLVILACVLKDNAIVVLYIPFIIAFLKSGSSIHVSIWLHNYFLSLFIVQYLLCLITFSYSSAPQVKNYPTVDQDCTQLLIAMGINGVCPVYKNWSEWMDWQNYFSVGDSTGKVAYLAIDAASLMLFSVYFRYFCTSLYELDIKPEERDDSKAPQANDIDLEASAMRRIEAATLKNCKRRRTLLKGFVSSAESFCLSHLHIIILCMIIVLAARSQGLLSIGYFLFCLIFLHRNYKFFKGQEEWKYPYWLRRFLQPYLLLDLLFQMAIELPFSNKASSKAWKVAFLIQPPAADSGTLILKLLTIVLVALQGKIFCSGEFARFVDRNLKESQEMLKLKGLCCTYLYNNRRVFQHMKYEQKKVKNAKKLEKVREQLREWSEKLRDSEAKQGLFQIRRVSPERPKLSFHSPSASSEIEALSNQLNKISSTLKGRKALHKNAVKNWVGTLGRLYIWVFSKINHVLFKSEYKLRRFFELTKKGATSFPSRLEKMAIGCEELKFQIEKAKVKIRLAELTEDLKQIKLEEKKIKAAEKIARRELKYLKRQRDIKSFVKFSHILKHYWLCFYRLILSSTGFYCYFAMLLAQLFSGSVLSVIYPVSVFLYCLVEHCRPRWGYWTFILLYTEVVLGVKFVIQLDAVGYWMIDKKTLNEYLLNGYRLGLKVFDSALTFDFLLYVLFDLLVILTVLIHQHVLIFSGVYERREVDQETVLEAIDRLAAHRQEHKTPEELKLPDSSLPEEDKCPNEFEQDKQSESAKRKPNCCARLFNHVAFENGYARTLFPRLKVEKPGVDYNGIMIYLQLLLAVYIILLYSRMSADYESIAQSLQYISLTFRFREFSSEMILVLLGLILIIILERYFYLKEYSPAAKNPASEDRDSSLALDEMVSEEYGMLVNCKREVYGGYNYGLLMKLALHYVLVIGVMFMIFWYFPNWGNMKLTGEPICRSVSIDCNDATSNIWIALFYIIFCIYFALSAQQISYGWPEMRNVKSLRNKVSLVNKLLVKTYLVVPFLFEINLLMDWAFTRTSLTIFQWFKFDEVYGNTYYSKCIFEEFKPLGTKIAAFMKLLFSVGGLLAALVLAVGPMVIFSSLNPIAQDNKITGAGVSFGIYVDNQLNTYELLSTSQIVSLVDMSAENFKQRKLDQVDEVKSLDPVLMQVVVMQKYSDTEWRPTPQAKEGLIGHLADPDVREIKFYLKSSFRRSYKSEYAAPASPFVKDVDSHTRANLHNAIANCQPFSITLPLFYNKVVKLFSESAGTIVGTSRPDIVGETVVVSLDCTKIKVDTEDGEHVISTYSWALKSVDRGIEFITWSEQVTTAILGYTALTLYISVVIVIGNYLKGVTRGEANLIIVNDMPAPDELLNLCEGIIIYRLEGNLKMEAELYYILIDIFRSPEILKIITGGSLETMKKKESAA